ncbi:hypothetical protein GCM10022421_16630 [Oceanisphaera sediminis]|uniref:DNA2/NAM7 helicase-like C-terminal domain-containing protein n=1 Tax=Oceanisphaera sediminis TaxID=981381 RepID=A0ABP7DUD0_9GAMM
MNQPDLSYNVLDCWHKIEFFESADIQELHRRGEGVICYSLSELQNNPACLPWLNHQQIRRAGAGYSPTRPYHYSLYLGIFDRREIFAAAREAYPHWARDDDERLDDEGLTCSIKFTLDQHGQFDPTTLACSTVTWALGQLQSHKLESIRLEAYETACGKLQERLQEIVTIAGNLKSEHRYPSALTTFELLEFLKAMGEWTTFAPQCFDKQPALLIQLIEPNPKNAGSGPADLSDQPPRLLEQLSTSMLENKERGANRRQPGQESVSQTSGAPEEVAILNSFYLRDIERVKADIAANGLNKDSPLGRYLSEHTPHRPDLLTAQGESVLRDGLRLSRLPAGRWPGEDHHAMSLMQQFAINTIAHELRNCGLYSVNGPPGTGKTTMLRDLLAHNLVERAGILAGLTTAAGAFGPAFTFSHKGGSKTVKALIPALTGFEMVVASSNNTAVENISMELPQLKSLGQPYRQSAYLKPVARKLAAEHCYPNNKLARIKPLSAEDDCWGLIAATLGKSANRSRFGNQVFFKTIDNLDAPPAAKHYRTLVPALRDLAANGNPQQQFARAQAAFRSAREQVKNIREELCHLEALHDLEAECETQQRRLDGQKLRLARLEARLVLYRSRLPSRWQFRRRCRGQAILQGLQQRHELLTRQLAVARIKQGERLDRRAAEQRHCAHLEKRYEDAIFAGPQTKFEDAEVQRKAFGQCLALNQARARLTVAALELHQAWLVAAYADKQTRFQEASFVLMDTINGKVDDKEAARALWQLLFMVVPLISSTFASVARQFTALNSGDIGWLFIDEAGQACPQQAVGALWRARRAVVVGDPLQIEPVFTIPPAFVEALTRQSLGENWQQWSPDRTSVQLLADRSNPYGTRQINQQLWLGSPLRVHRRCDEPMFSIANRIAYGNKMIHGSDSPHDPAEFIWGPSTWFDIRGEVQGRHFVPEQARHVLHMLDVYLREHGAFPDLYIITPFREIKKALQRYLKDVFTKQIGHDVVLQKQLQELLSRRIGTVHTFQGREEKNVFLVLGLSQEHSGAANWASGTPNLLNVAVTRAQKRVYVIGCAATWGGLPFFADACAALMKAPRPQNTRPMPVPALKETCSA